MKRLLLVLLFVASNAYSAGTCYQWATGSVYYDTAKAALDAYAAYCNASINNIVTCGNGISGSYCVDGIGTQGGGVGHEQCYYTGTLTAGTWPAYTVNNTVTQYRNGSVNNTSTRSFALVTRTNPNGCPECPASGTSITIALSAAAESGTSACTSDGCKVTTSSPTRYIISRGASNYFASATTTGFACSATATTDATNASANGGDCQQSSDGVTSCMNTGVDGARGCGTYNGDYICTAAQPAGTCQSTPSGGSYCVTAHGSTAAPAGTPDNGTVGVPATPSVTGKYGDQRINYYSSTTVHNSTTYNSSTGTTTGSATTTAGTSAGGGSGTSSSGSGSGGGSDSSSSADSTCTDDCQFTAPANEAVPTIAQSTTSYGSRINNAPIMLAVSGIGASLPSGVCPSGSVTLFGHSITLDIQCTLWDQIAPILSLVFLAGWAFSGLKIIMSA